MIEAYDDVPKDKKHQQQAEYFERSRATRVRKRLDSHFPSTPSVLQSLHRVIKNTDFGTGTPATHTMKYSPVMYYCCLIFTVEATRHSISLGRCLSLNEALVDKRRASAMGQFVDAVIALAGEAQVAPSCRYLLLPDVYYWFWSVRFNDLACSVRHHSNLPLLAQRLCLAPASSLALNVREGDVSWSDVIVHLLQERFLCCNLCRLMDQTTTCPAD